MSRQNVTLLRKAGIPALVRRVILAWLAAAAMEYLFLPAKMRDLAGIDGLAQMSFVRVIGITCGIALLLFLLSRFVPSTKAERWLLVGSFAVLGITALGASFTWAFLTACVLVLGVLVSFTVWGWDSSPEPAAKPKKAHKAYLWITVGLSTLFFLFVSAWTVGRVSSFCAPTYDFGIFFPGLVLPCHEFFGTKRRRCDDLPLQ